MKNILMRMWGLIMNKKGVTILEVLVSVVIVSIVVLLLIKVMLSLSNINNDTSYASNDEISRTTIIKNIEKDFLELKLKGIEIEELEDKTLIKFSFKDIDKTLTINKNSVLYDEVEYKLNSNKATYDLCINYDYIDVDENYFLVKINIPVLIDDVNTTLNDDLILTYMDLKNSDNNYLSSYSCLKR